MKEFFKDFVKFIKKGNIFDLATGIIIGASFNAIVQSLVNDIVMPLVGLIVRSDIATLKVELVPAVVNDAGDVVKKAITLNYGNFIQTIINFIIIALSIFIAIRVIIKLQKKAEALKNKVIKHEEEQQEEVNK